MKHLRKLQLVYWKIFKPKTQGVRALLIKDDNILLVKHSYIDGWYLPGGGISKGENPKQSLERELREELEVKTKNLELLGEYHNEYEGKRDTIFCYVCKDFEFGDKDNREVVDAKLFPLDDLPADISPGSKRRILEYTRGKSNLNTTW